MLARTLSLKTYFILTLLENNSSAVFEATIHFATTCQIDSYKVSNSKLKPDLWNRAKCVKIEIIDLKLLHSRHKNGARFFGASCRIPFMAMANRFVPMLHIAFSFVYDLTDRV